MVLLYKPVRLLFGRVSSFVLGEYSRKFLQQHRIWKPNNLSVCKHFEVITHTCKYIYI